MKRIVIQVEGFTPLLQHNPTELMQQETGVKAKRAHMADDEYSEKACYRNEDGTLYHPAEAFRNALIEAATNRKVGRIAATSVIRQAVFLAHDRAELCDPATGEALTEFTMDLRSVVIGKARIMRARPRFDRWATGVEFVYNPDFVSDANIIELLEIAGTNIGVGDYRPGRTSGMGKGGPMGRFKIVGHEVFDDEGAGDSYFKEHFSAVKIA